MKGDKEQMCNSITCLRSRLEGAQTLADYNLLIKDCSSLLSAKADLETEIALYNIIESATVSARELITPSDPFGWEGK